MFYLKLSKENIKRDMKTYLPYGIVSTTMVVIFYVLASILYNDVAKKISFSLGQLMAFGVIITGFFATIFMLYLNSFLMKKRKSELGLYNVLGMNKNHLIKLVIVERLILGVVTIVSGIILGIIFGKFLFLILLKLIKVNEVTTFGVSLKAIVITLILFIGIDILAVIGNIISIKKSNTISLLKSKKAGEKEPKGRIIIGIIGILTLGFGYYNAFTIENPVIAMNALFIDIILVMIGLYCLFTSGSIIILKFLKKRKNIYYKTNNFISIGSMIYRMKKNAIGLANICILSTAVVLALSTSVTLFIGTQKIIDKRYPSNMNMVVMDSNIEKVKAIQNLLKSVEKENFHESIEKGNMYVIENGKLNEEPSKQQAMSNYVMTTFIPISIYNEEMNKDIKLKSDQALIFSKNIEYKNKTMEIDSKKYNVTKVKDIGRLYSEDNDIMDSLIIIMNDNYFKNDLKYTATFDVAEKNINSVKKTLKTELKNLDVKNFAVRDKIEAGKDFRALYGGFLFMGVLISVVFLFGTILIIYYKQISEGFDDKERFATMKKVGISEMEIKNIIRKQVMTVFMLPCVFAAINLFFAYPMIEKILILLNLRQTEIFPIIITGTMIVYIVLYVIVYRITSKVYYKAITN